MSTKIRRSGAGKLGMFIKYFVCIILALLSLFPFYIMIVNSTRDTYSIQQSAISLIPSNAIAANYQVLEDKLFNPLVGFKNSLIISTASTILTIYFSTLTAYALVAYQWKLKNFLFGFILAVMMIPGQVVAIGFFQFMFNLGMTNNLLALILPSIAAPGTVFFMRQYMLPSLSMDIVASARIDGAGEFRTFNSIVLPIMKPAMATQAIFAFVTSWNRLFEPLILLTRKEKYTMPIMVSLLKGDIYKTEYGSVYLALTMSVLPLLIVYFILSKYIIAGVALGGVKE